MDAMFTPYVWKASVLEPKCGTEKPSNDNSASNCHERGHVSIVTPHEKGPEINSLIAWDTNGNAGFNYEQIPEVVQSAKERVDVLSTYLRSNERFLTLIEADIIILGTDDEEVKKYITDFHDTYGVGTKIDFSNQLPSESVETALFCLAGVTHDVKIQSPQEYVHQIPEKCRQIKYEEAQKISYLWMLALDKYSGKITLGGLAPGTGRKSSYLVADDLIQKVLH